MRQMMVPLFTLALGTFFWASTATAGNYALDATHSKVGFSVKYMMFSSTHGKFDAFTIDANLNEKDLSKSTVSVIIDATSINTENAKRDGHLKSPDFLMQRHIRNLSSSHRAWSKMVKPGSSMEI